MSTAKARTLLAKYQSLANASEFIRSHGEEGFSFDDDEFNKIYLRESQKTAERLNKRAEKYLQEYERLGIEINDKVDNSY